MTQAELLKIIEEAKKSGQTELDLSGNQLTHLPPEIGNLTNLTVLDITNNSLKEFPWSLSKLKKLERSITLCNPQFGALNSVILMGMESLHQYYEYKKQKPWMVSKGA